MMEFLKRAEAYCEARDDGPWFKDYYTRFRESYGVEDSVWKTLAWLYDDEIADSLQNQ